LNSGHEKISILFVPEGEGESRSFRISKATIRLLIVGLIIFFMLLFAGVISYFFISIKASRYEQTLEDNLRLLEENRRIIKLSEELERLKSFNYQIRKAMGAVVGLDTTQTDTGIILVQQKEVPTPIFNIAEPVFNLPVEGFISRRQNYNLFPAQPHYGLDIAVPEGSLVSASADGWVVFKGWHYRFGNLLIIQHPGDFLTYYGHNLSIIVDIGEKVQSGQPVAVSGNTGRSTAPHLHFEIRRRGLAIDPENIISGLVKEPLDTLNIPSSMGEQHHGENEK